MRRYATICALAALCLVLRADEAYREFTDRQGRTAKLLITACDWSRGRVTVEGEDRRRTTVDIAGFSGSDQAYIREWYMANDMISDRNLEIECDDTQVGKRRVEVIGYERVDTDSSDPYDYELERSLVGYKHYEQVAFKVAFENGTDEPIRDARLEYIIFYEQAERGFAPRVEQMSLAGSTNLPTTEVEVLTRAAEVYRDDLSTAVGSIDGITGLLITSRGLRNAEGEVHGIRARFYVKLPSGKEAMRAFHHPPSLSEKDYPWDDAMVGAEKAVE